MCFNPDLTFYHSTNVLSFAVSIFPLFLSSSTVLPSLRLPDLAGAAGTKKGDGRTVPYKVGDGRTIPTGFLLSDLRKLRDRLLQLLVRRDEIVHLVVVVSLVSHHIEVSRTGQAEHDILCFAGLLAL